MAGWAQFPDSCRGFQLPKSNGHRHSERVSFSAKNSGFDLDVSILPNAATQEMTATSGTGVPIMTRKTRRDVITSASVRWTAATSS
jgi:hypothetical protein